MLLCSRAILITIFFMKNTDVCLAAKMMKYSRLGPGKVTQPAHDVIKSVQVNVEQECLLHCHVSDSCTSYEMSANSGNCTLRKLFSTDPVNQQDAPGVIAAFLGKYTLKSF